MILHQILLVLSWGVKRVGQMSNTRQTLLKSIQKVEDWVENHDCKGYEPFDGLSSFLRPLTFDNLFLERLFLQLVRQSPINLRPLIGIKPKDSTKGRGYMARGYITMLKHTGDQGYKEKAEKCLDWLLLNKAQGYHAFSWGNHYDYASRGGKYLKYEPIIVWTSLIGQAFLDAYVIMKRKKYLKIAKSISDWILQLPREETNSGSCLSYFHIRQSSIHNSNMLGAAMLARTAKYTSNTKSVKVAKKAMEYSCSRQLPNGAWYYGEAPNLRWIDNFHTGYNLESLSCYIKNTGDNTFTENLNRGLQFFKETFITKNGIPKYYHNRLYPIDIQCASQTIDTLAYFSNTDDTALDLAIKVAKWTIKNMQNKKGNFYYRKTHLYTINTPMIHWGQATMYKALTHLLTKL